MVLLSLLSRSMIGGDGSMVFCVVGMKDEVEDVAPPGTESDLFCWCFFFFPEDVFAKAFTLTMICS